MVVRYDCIKARVFDIADDDGDRQPPKQEKRGCLRSPRIRSHYEAPDTDCCVPGLIGAIVLASRLSIFEPGRFHTRLLKRQSEHRGLVCKLFKLSPTNGCHAKTRRTLSCPLSSMQVVSLRWLVTDYVVTDGLGVNECGQ